VASPEEPDGTELQLALNDNPAAKAYQQAIFQQGRPAVMFYTDDVRGDYERIKDRQAEFTMPPTDVTGSTIAMLKDTCGNLIQLNAHKDKVKLTFAHGASLPDPDKLFNAGLEGNTWRAIDFFEGDKINECALKNLVRAAIEYNQIKLKRKASGGTRAKVIRSKK
jgi:hypothetical protein